MNRLLYEVSSVYKLFDLVAGGSIGLACKDAKTAAEPGIATMRFIDAPKMVGFVSDDVSISVGVGVIWLSQSLETQSPSVLETIPNFSEMLPKGSGFRYGDDT